MPKGYNFPRGNCIHCVGVGTNVKEEFDVADLLNVAAKTLGNGKFGSGYKAGLIVLLLKLMSRLLALHLYIRNVRNKNAQERVVKKEAVRTRADAALESEEHEFASTQTNILQSIFLRLKRRIDESCTLTSISLEEYDASVPQRWNNGGLVMGQYMSSVGTGLGSLACLKDQGHMMILDQASGAPDPVPISALVNCPAFYDNDDEDDDEEYTIVITPVLPTVEPNNSLSMGEEHLSTILEKKESSVDALKDHYEIFFDPNDDYASSDDDTLYSEGIDYVDASPLDFGLSVAFPTSHSDLSLPNYKAFYCDNEPDLENFTIDLVEDSFDNQTRELYVHVPNVLPTHPSLYLDSNFAPSDDSLGSDLVVSFPSGNRTIFAGPGFSLKSIPRDFLSRLSWSFEASRARGFVPRSLELQSLA
ncbi:hypothetical protein Tco_0560746 [Tanacetum coccineum]